MARPFARVEIEFNELLEQLKFAPSSSKEDLFHQGGIILKRMEREIVNEEFVHQKTFVEKHKRHRNMLSHLQG